MRAILYTWSSCSFCQRAKELLDAHGIDYREVVLDGRKDELRRLQEAFGRCTVPLALIDGELVAGLDELERHFRDE
jgi:glutaredoxin